PRGAPGHGSGDEDVTGEHTPGSGCVADCAQLRTRRRSRYEYHGRRDLLGSRGRRAPSLRSRTETLKASPHHFLAAIKICHPERGRNARVEGPCVARAPSMRQARFSYTSSLSLRFTYASMSGPVGFAKTVSVHTWRSKQ